MNEVETISEDLLDQASEWLVKLRSDRVSEKDKVEFALWLSADDQRRAAFDRTVELWEVLGTSHIASELAEALQTSLDEKFDEACSEPAEEDKKNQRISSIVRTHSYAPASEISSKPADAMQPGLQKSPNLAATPVKSKMQRFKDHFDGKMFYSSSIAACLMLLVWFVKPSSTPVEHPIETYTTQAGEQRTVTLRDGSRIDLNSRSSVKVAYSEGLRSAKLIKGEAFFSVAPNKQRPFTVDFGHGTIRVLGTAFNVNRYGNNIFNISVLEGHVRVAEKKNTTNPEPKIQDLVASQQIIFNHRGLGIPQVVDVTKVLAWRDQTIVFDNTPLSEAIEQLNRYLIQPVDASDVSLETIAVSGTFALDSPKETLSAIKTTFNLVEKDAKLMTKCEG